MMTTCPFCRHDELEVLHETPMSLAVRDGFPVSRGHTLIIPRRHVASFFELSTEEQMDLIQVATRCKVELDKSHKPTGYNLGINDGAAAGQTVMHVHLHLIPRYDGDQDDPRGGIRWVLPEKAVYWEDKNQ